MYAGRPRAARPSPTRLTTSGVEPSRCIGIRRSLMDYRAAEGARVVVNYSSDRSGAERVAQEIKRAGGDAVVVGADISKAADVRRLFTEVETAFSGVDVMVNNAGVFRFGPFEEVTEDAFHAHYNINVLGPILTMQEAVKRFGPD